MEKQIHVGLIGFGMAGQVFHAPILTSVPGFRLHKIFERKQHHQELARTLYPSAQIITETEDIFSDSVIDLVVIATPNILHFPLAKQALLKGKHVVVEKPFTVTSKEADELLELAREKKKLLTVHQNRRWDSDFKTVQKVISSGMLGKLVEYEAHYDRFRNYIKENAWREIPQPGSGILYDLGPHLIDQALCLFGLPHEVYADIRTQRNKGEADDAFQITLHYPEMKATLKASMLVREPLPHYILLGEQGSFIKYGLDPQEDWLKKGFSPATRSPWGEEPAELWGTINTEIDGLHVIGKIESEKGSYQSFYENVYQSVVYGHPLAVCPSQARNTIRIIELAFQSSQEKRTLPFSM